MKEVLIYGALVAAVIGASVPVIQGLTANVTTQGNAVNTSVNNQMQSLVNSIGSGSSN
jgi:hypothetical protein